MVLASMVSIFPLYALQGIASIGVGLLSKGFLEIVFFEKF
jgi:hypothetical protein